ncbi:hypothetical protein [Prochlorothrix hollandica]|uniref:hypothetical protein n=1 Tax=Prochlorothrix hollandica TaxID=1223 RepID=UPI00333FD799
MNAAIAPDFLLHCPNPHCLQHNPGDREHCQACNTRLLRRFLRVVGSLDEPPQPNQLLAGRYRWLGNGDDRIVLDTQPGQPPALMEEVPDPPAALPAPHAPALCCAPNLWVPQGQRCSDVLSGRCPHLRPYRR